MTPVQAPAAQEATPGPWYVAQVPGWGVGLHVARRPDYTGVIGDCPIAMVLEGAAGWENKFPADANARLIAAAPDLLAALQELLRTECLDDDDPRLNAARVQARAALARATGSEQ